MGYGRPQTRYLMDSKGRFPSGLLNRVNKAIIDEKWGVATTLEGRRIASILATHNVIKSNIPIPYDEQSQAVERAVTRHQGTIVMPTGSGKTLVAAMITSRLCVRTLIVVPNLELKQQFTETFRHYFGGDLSNIVIENIDSSNLTNLKDFGLLIIDECHHSAARTYQKLNRFAWNSIYYRICLTATPFRTEEEEQILMEGITGPVIYQLSFNSAVNNGQIVPIEGLAVRCDIKPVKGYTWPQVYSELVVNNEERNDKIGAMLLRLNQVGKSVLCLVKEVNHGLILSRLTGFPFSNGKDDDSRRFIKQFVDNEINVLISTSALCGEGTDTRSCEYVIIAGLGKAKNMFMQQCGRAVRRYKDKESGKVIIFQDKSHKYTLNHFRAQKKILKEEFGADLEFLEI